MSQRHTPDSQIHLQRSDHPEIVLPVCGTTNFEHTTTERSEVTCLLCIEFILREDDESGGH